MLGSKPDHTRKYDDHPEAVDDPFWHFQIPMAIAGKGCNETWWALEPSWAPWNRCWFRVFLSLQVFWGKFLSTLVLSRSIYIANRRKPCHKYRFSKVWRSGHWHFVACRKCPVTRPRGQFSWSQMNTHHLWRLNPEKNMKKMMTFIFMFYDFVLWLLTGSSFFWK